MSQIEISEPLVIEPAEEMPFMQRLFAKVFRPSIIQAGVVVLDQLSYSIATFVAFALIAKSVSKSDFGVLTLGLQLIYLLVLIQHNLIEIPYSVLSQPMSSVRKKIYTGSSLIQHVFLLLIQSILFVFLWYFVSISSSTDALYIYLSPLLLVLIAYNLRDYLRTTLVASFKVWKSCMLGWVINIALVSAVVAAYISGKSSLGLMFAILALCSLLPSIFMLYLSRKNMELNKSYLVSDCARNSKYGSWLLLGNLSGVGGLRLLPWMALIWCGQECVAAYGVVSVLSGAVRPLFKSLAKYLTPKLSNHVVRYGKRSAYRKIIVLTICIFGLGFVFLLLIGIFGRKFLRICFTYEYEQYSFELLVMVLGSIIKSANIPLKAMLTALKKPHWVFMSNLMASCVAIPLAFFLIPNYYLMGVVVVILVHYIATFLISILGVFVSINDGGFSKIKYAGRWRPC